MDKIEQAYKTISEKYGSQGWWPILEKKSGKSVYDEEFTKKERGPGEKLEICIGAILA